MIGETLGSYRVVEKIGEGGMGVVYLAEHPLIGRKAAIKVLLPALSADQEIVNRFFNEARTTAMIRHPGLVDVFDFGYHATGSAYLAMEFLDGESLGARLRREHRLSLAFALVVGRQVAGALAAAHAKGIVHRDLKPDNLFLVPDRDVLGGVRVKVLDFGIAKLAQEGAGSNVKTRTGAVMGTPLYMSPEQCKGAGTVDHRADVYALGCILYECVCGRPPFTGEGFGEIIGKHMYEAAVPPARVVQGVPAELDALIMRSLAKAAAERFQSMAELEAALDAVAATLPPATGSTTGGAGGAAGARVATGPGGGPISSPAAFAGTMPTPPVGSAQPAPLAPLAPTIAPANLLGLPGGGGAMGPPSTLGAAAAEAAARSVPSTGAGRYSRRKWLYGGVGGALAAAMVAVLAFKTGGGSGGSSSKSAAPPVAALADDPRHQADTAGPSADAMMEAQAHDQPPDAGVAMALHGAPDAGVAAAVHDLDKKDLDDLVARVQPRVNRCADPNGAADVVLVKISIGAEGKVFKAEAQGDLQDTKVGRCVEGVLEHAKLPGTGKRETATIRLKLVPGKGDGGGSHAPPEGTEPTTNGLTSDEVLKVVRSRRGVFEACYQKELQGHPDLKGRIMVTWRIDGTGAVSMAKVKESTMGDEVVEDCIVYQVKALRFPAAPDGKDTTVNFPFLFGEKP